MLIGLLLLLLTSVWAQDPATVKLPDTAAARLLDAHVEAFNTERSAAVPNFTPGTTRAATAMTITFQ